MKSRTLQIGLRHAILSVIAGLAISEASGEWPSHLELEFADGQEALAIADVNNDKLPDIVAAFEDRNEFQVLLADGKGLWAKARTFSAGENPTSIAIADFDADGDPDIIIANHEKPYLSFARGDGDGTFRTFEAFVGVDVRPHPHEVNAVDLNDDQLIDLIVDSRDRRSIVAIPGSPDGKFAAPGTAFDVKGAPYLGFAVGDINGDGRPDVVTPNADHVAIILNESSPAAIMLTHSHTVPFPRPFAVGLGDFDGDGKIDLVVASEEAGKNVAIFSGDGKGQISAAPTSMFELAAGAKQLTIGDFDGDSVSDVVVSSWNQDAIIVSRNGEDFAAGKLPLGGIQVPWGIAAGDIDGDGRDDLVISDGESALANLYLGSDFRK